MFQDFFELVHNGESCYAERILRYDTGKDAVMNFTVCTKNSCQYLAAGQDERCQLYEVKYEFHDPVDTDERKSNSHIVLNYLTYSHHVRNLICVCCR